MKHQVSHGDADHDPWKYSDIELAYLYGQVGPHYPVPAVLCPLCHQLQGECYLSCKETWFNPAMHTA